jgi:hypothetical protein
MKEGHLPMIHVLHYLIAKKANQKKNNLPKF